MQHNWMRLYPGYLALDKGICYPGYLISSVKHYDKYFSPGICVSVSLKGG